MVKAAESGASDDDSELYRDSHIRPPAYDSSRSIECASPTLQSLVGRTYRD